MGGLTNLDAVTLFVDDPRRSKAFYEAAFGAQVIFEDADSVAFRFDNVVVNLLARTAAPELVEPAAVGRVDAGARVLLTLRVDDTDTVCAGLAARGVAVLNGPVDRPWGVRTAAFADPDGHVWEVAQQLGRQPGD